MPASLLPSQLAIGEPLGAGEVGFAVHVDGGVDCVVDTIMTRLAPQVRPRVTRGRYPPQSLAVEH